MCVQAESKKTILRSNSEGMGTDILRHFRMAKEPIFFIFFFSLFSINSMELGTVIPAYILFHILMNQCTLTLQVY